MKTVKYELLCKNCLTAPSKKQIEDFIRCDKALICKECKGEEFERIPLPEHAA
jgi:predicted SprT family Zn-dependent metalloprotease